MTTNVQKFATDKEVRANLKAQLAEYLAQAPESAQSAHKWMKRVDVAGLGIVTATFILALYGSFTWPSVNPSMIPVAWFAFATSLSLMVVLFGLHAILIRAFPPVILPGKPGKFISGSGAAWIGAASIVGGFILAALWVAFAYSTATFNMTILEPLIRIFAWVVGTGMTVAILYAVFQKVSQHR